MPHVSFTSQLHCHMVYWLFSPTHLTFCVSFFGCQIQDAANHLTSALDLLTSPPLRFSYDQGKYDFHSADEVIQVSVILVQLNHKCDLYFFIFILP